MKKHIILLISILFLLLFTSCSKKTFIGNELTTSASYNLRFSELQGEKKHTMNFSEGDKVQVVIDKIKGSLTLSIEDETGNNIYKGSKIESSSFVLGIPKSGTYTIEIKGKKAIGSIDIEILDTESQNKVSIIEKLKELDGSTPFNVGKSCHNIFMGYIGSTPTIMDVWVAETSKDVIFSLYSNGKEERYVGTFLGNTIVGFDSENVRFAFAKNITDGLDGVYSSDGIKYENVSFTLSHSNYTFDKEHVYSYGENTDVESFANKILDLVNKKDIEELSKLIDYPISLNFNDGTIIKDKNAFMELDPSIIFTDNLLTSIENSTKKYFFSNSQGIMIGLPEFNIWFTQMPNGDFKIISINM